MRNLVGVLMAALLFATPALAQKRLGVDDTQSMDSTFGGRDPHNYTGAAPPNLRPNGMQSPIPPTPENSGKWIYKMYYIHTKNTNGFAIYYYNLTCAGPGECPPTTASATCRNFGFAGVGECYEGINVTIPMEW